MIYCYVARFINGTIKGVCIDKMSYWGTKRLNFAAFKYYLEKK